MSEYQKYWNSEIEKLLVELEGSEELHAKFAYSKALCFVSKTFV